MKKWNEMNHQEKLMRLAEQLQEELTLAETPVENVLNIIEISKKMIAVAYHEGKSDVKSDTSIKEERHLILQTLSKTECFYTEDEVKKLIEAYHEKYNISHCDRLPYQMKPIKALVGLQIIDTEKIKV